jgi:ribosome-associated heat shock protein Hsp15
VATSVREDRVRLDKWLWAARFYKTRELSAEAISGGKVHYKGQRVKPGRVVEVGAEVAIRQGPVERVVVVRGLARQRRPASEARCLYEETQESRCRCEALAQALKERPTAPSAVKGRPTKRARRRLERLFDKGFGG